MISKQLIITLVYLLLIQQQGSSETPVCIRLTGKQEVIQISQGTERCLAIPIPHLPGAKQIRLRWKARVEGGGGESGRWQMQVEINRAPVGPDCDGRLHAGIHKPPMYLDARGEHHVWYTEKRRAWMTPSASSFTPDGLEGMFRGANEDVFTYSVDVSDYLQPDRINQIVFRHLDPASQGFETLAHPRAAAQELFLEDVCLVMDNSAETLRSVSEREPGPVAVTKYPRGGQKGTTRP